MLLCYSSYKTSRLSSGSVVEKSCYVVKRGSL
jgi:hypothetical protein